MKRIKNADWDTWEIDGLVDSPVGSFPFGVKNWRDYADGYGVHMELMHAGYDRDVELTDDKAQKIDRLGYALVDWLNGERSPALLAALNRSKKAFDPDEDVVAALVSGQLIKHRISQEHEADCLFVELELAGGLLLYMTIGSSFVTRNRVDDILFNNMRKGGLNINDLT